MKIEHFSRASYVSLLEAFRGSGYRFSTFHDSAAERCLILRHDIDFSVADAAEMAELEREQGVRATYFILLTSEFYNPLTPASRAGIERILEAGAQLGLHFDPTAHDDPDAGFALERRTFEESFGVALDIVSLHRPRDFLDDNNRKLPGGISHTYEDRYFKHIAYISDSAGEFRFGSPLDSPAFREGRTIHLNLHPIWWMRGGSTASDRLRDWQKEHFDRLDAEVGRNCRSYDGRNCFADDQSLSRSRRAGDPA